MPASSVETETCSVGGMAPSYTGGDGTWPRLNG
jgi:hypothetical protein